MKRTLPFATLLCAMACSHKEAGAPGAKQPDQVEVKLCDNQTVTSIPADMKRTNENGQKIADALMRKWHAKNPGVDWEAEERQSRTFKPAADNSAIVGTGQASGSPYQNFSDAELLVWKRETEKMVVAGSKVFHDAGELGSTIAVSCDMCHPSAANTHPETYPKFQTQLGRVALLRDMINWCLQHPVRAPPMDADDPRMRGLEAYITSQRAGIPMEYGKH